MKYRLIFITLILIVTFALSACQKSAAENNQVKPQNLPTALPTVSLSPTPAPNLDSSIREVDFKNFSYAFTDIVGNFTLRNGEKPRIPKGDAGIHLDKVEYADVTNDEAEEAILTMSVETGGSSIPSAIFIYTMKKNKPNLLWNFVTGDRAEGGLKELYVENGELAVELFGDSKIVNDKWSFSVPKEKDLGAGRPAVYTKNRFKWNGKQFVVQGNPELFDYDANKEIEKTQ